jgi:lactate dehydrogenase-like 2-hydroxyacid dehydrogenase
VTARPSVVVTRRLPGVVEEELSQDFDARLNREDRPLGSAGLQDALRSADAILCTVTDRLTAEVLSAEPLRARMRGRF